MVSLMVWLGVLTVVSIVVVLALLMRGDRGGGDGLPHFRPGTRAFEAALTLGPLKAAIEQRRLEHEHEADPVRKERLQRELLYLVEQVPRLQAIVDAKDESPGRGYIGFDNLPADQD
jgi:hypothetical protein